MVRPKAALPVLATSADNSGEGTKGTAAAATIDAAGGGGEKNCGRGP